MPRAAGVLRTLLAFGLACTLTSAAVAADAPSPSTLARRERIAAMDASTSVEAHARKARSLARLRAEGVPVLESLPVIEDSTQATMRARDVVAYRALALLVVAVKGEGLEQPVVDEIVQRYGLASHFTPVEAAFIADASPTQQDRVQFSWRHEAAWTLLWALGYVERLDRPDAVCDVPRAVAFMRDRSTATFIAEAKPRPLSALLDEADLIYRYHWAVTDARVSSEPTPAGLDAGVTMERHYALNWLIGYMGQAWDDVTTDT